jgi:hypothetical protein
VGVVEGGLWPGQGGLRGSPQDVDADAEEAPLPAAGLIRQEDGQMGVRLVGQEGM